MAVSMTTPSSPVTPQHEQLDNNVLTPRRKVKALLAQFDVSDSDRSPSTENAEIPPYGAGATCSNDRAQDRSTRFPRVEGPGPDNEEPSEGPRGSLAAKMQTASTNNHSEFSEENSGANFYASTSDRTAQKSMQKATATEAVDNESSSDELQRPVPTRRLQQNCGATDGDHLSHQGTGPASPLSSPSPSTTKSPEVTASRHKSQHEPDSYKIPEDPLNQTGSKFLALVEKHRKQRLAREAADEAKRAERLKQLTKAGSRGPSVVRATTIDRLSDESDISEEEAGNRLTQQARPTRKASKKALEEMSRETQRMSRGMQLAHQARTKKKITKESLLARFDFVSPGSLISQPADTRHTSPTASSAPGSDVEDVEEQKTPPTSPLLLEKDEKPVSRAQTSAETMEALMEDARLPAMEVLLTPRAGPLAKGKGKAVAVDETSEPTKLPIMKFEKPQPHFIRMQSSKRDAVIPSGGDSDSDLEIITSNSRSKRLAAFESLPRRRFRETNSHLILRSLAHLQTARAADKHASINAAQMEAHLRRSARMQAQKEREEKLEELRSKGVFIQSAEERQKELQEVEDLVERARVEGAEIQRREREIAKKDGTFVKDQFDDDESDDEEDAEVLDENEQNEDQLSDSEEDTDDGSEMDDDSEVDREDSWKLKRDGGREREGADIIEQEADEAGSGHSETDESNESDKENQPSRLPARSRRALVLTDDEDDEEDNARYPSRAQGTKTPQSLLCSARKIIPGLQMSDDLPIGLTQAFAATMAESETQNEEADTQEQDSLLLTRDLPSPHFNGVPSLNRLESLDIVTDSQPTTQTQPLDLRLSISQTRAIPQSPIGISSTQLSFIPTQDAGCVMSPFKENRFDTPSQAAQSTIDTVLLQQDHSPSLQRKGRLRRGRGTITSEDDAVASESGLTGLGLDESAFAVMRRAAKSVNEQGGFDKSKSHAKEVVDEAAEESDDEYAGLGGVSDDDEGEEDEADRQIIDQDETLGQGDESKLAGFYADKEREKDEAAVSKLLKDIATGALRRKRVAADDIDLSDEEDASARRREAKRREFARMRRELLKDEAVGKIAEDKKKQAFLKSIEDRDTFEDEEIAFDEEEMTEDSQSQTRAAGEMADTTEVPTTDNDPLRRRPLEPSAADITNLPAPGSRRTGNKPSHVHHKPSTLAEIREHVSFLIDEPDSQNGPMDPDSSEEEAQGPEAYANLDRHLHQADEEENQGADEGLADFIVDDERPAFKKPQLPATRAPATERRTKANVVDRINLLRQASSSSAGRSTHTGSKLAFFSSSKSSDDPSSVKIPSLLRRATSNSSGFNPEAGSTVSATGVTERGAADQEKEMIRKAQGGKRSAINYYAKGRVEEREKVRQGRVDKSGMAKKAAKKGRGKGKGGFLGELFGRDSWE